MKKHLLLIITALCFTNLYCQSENEERYNRLKYFLDSKNYACGRDTIYRIKKKVVTIPKPIIQPHSLDDYIYSTYGKLALDNDDFIANASAFSAKFDNDAAQIAANYTAPVKNSRRFVWSLGGKADADDGTYYLFKASELNFGIGLQGGITIFGGRNGIFYDSIQPSGRYTCDFVHDLRSDTIRKLYLKYYRLISLILLNCRLAFRK